jgi:hypothetical protein
MVDFVYYATSWCNIRVLKTNREFMPPDPYT